MSDAGMSAVYPIRLIRFSSSHAGNTRRLLAAIVPLAIAAACSDADVTPDGGVVAVVDTTGGVVHVGNAGTAPEWTATPVLRIGSVDGGPEEFGRIRSLLADAQGNVYVADNLASEIRVFDRQGQHLRTIGRRGRGPAEFGDLYSLAWLGHNVVAMDPRNARIAVLSSVGQWIDGIPHYPITGPASLVRLHPLDTLGFYTPIMSQQGQLPFVRITAAGARDTILAPQWPEGARQTGVLCDRPDGGITSIAVPDAPRIVYAFAPPGGVVAVSWTESYRIAFLDSAGDTLRVITHEQPLVPYPDSVWQEAMKPYVELKQQFPGVRCEPDAPIRPPFRAALRQMLFDESARLWVESASESGFAWDVFDPQGRLIGRAPAPNRSSAVPPYVRDGYLYQVEADTLGVQHVTVYRVAPVD